MTNIFYSFYVFTSKHKTVGGILLFLFCAISLYLGYNIRLEENIINLIPRNEEVSKINKALEGFKMNSRLIVHVYDEDSTSADPQRLVNVSHQLSESLKDNYSAYIQDIKLEYNDSSIQLLYAFFAENLPFYLQEEDYIILEDRVSKDGIEKAMLKNYKALISPISIVSKKMLMQDPFSLVSIPLQRTKKLQLDDNIQLYQNHLFSKDRKHLIFFIALSQAPSETAKNGKLIAGLNEQMLKFESENPGVKIEYFGAAATSVANASRIKQDILLTVGLAVVALFFFIFFFYRSFLVFFIAVTPGLFGAIAAIASLAILRSSVSVISLAVGSILLGITIDYALHFFTHYKDHKNVEALFKDLTTPLLMSSLTTSCAFFSLAFLRTSALADLGIFAGISVVAAALYTLTVLPHLLIKKNPSSIKPSSEKNIVERSVIFLAASPFYKAKWSILVCLLITFVSLFTWQNYKFESDMLRLNYMPDHLEAYEKNINKISTYSANSLFLISEGGSIWEALEAELKVKTKLQELQDDGLIINYFSLSDLIPPLSIQKERKENWKEFWDSKNTDSIAYELNKKAVELGFKPNSFGAFEVLLDKDFALLETAEIDEILALVGEDFIIRRGDSVSIVSSVKISKENKNEVLTLLADLAEPLIFDKGYLASQLVTLLQEDFSKLINISLVVVFLIILISYGRIELAIIAFIPILLSWLWILGLMGLFHLRFNIINIIICTFIFGLGVDYSIFVIRGYTQYYNTGQKTITSYKKSIILSAVTTLVSIGVLAFAVHPALQSIALLAIIGISAVVFISFTVQPMLYNLLVLRRKRKGVVPYTLLSLFLSLFAFSYFLTGCFLMALLRLFFLLPIASQDWRKESFHWILMVFCRSLIYIMANLKKEIRGREYIDFNNPSVIICNHHSFMDIIILLMFHPKVVMVTNEWVYNSPFFGKVVQFAEFVPATRLEGHLENIKKLVKRGYSIVVFPEGTRSDGFKIGRFHKGAFYLAEVLQLDIQSVLLHGTNYTLPQKDPFHVKSGRITVQFLPRIRYNDENYGQHYAERTKKISRYFKQKYELLRNELETPIFFKEVLIKNFIYKGPVLEWYLRVKFHLEGHYQLFHDLVPKEATIMDLGCGYGFLSYSLAFCGERREVLAVDYDANKLKIAKNCPVKPPNLKFNFGDLTNFPLQASDVFIVSDVLHYLMVDEQKILLDNILKNLNDGGKIIIRDGDTSKKERHNGTVLTEIFSTKSGFNKTKNQLCFISEEMITQFAVQNNLEISIVDNTKHTSNTIYVLEHKNNGKV